jgi:hypothetical protein
MSMYELKLVLLLRLSAFEPYWEQSLPNNIYRESIFGWPNSPSVQHGCQSGSHASRAKGKMGI